MTTWCAGGFSFSIAEILGVGHENKNDLFFIFDEAPSPISATLRDDSISEHTSTEQSTLP